MQHVEQNAKPTLFTEKAMRDQVVAKMKAMSVYFVPSPSDKKLAETWLASVAGNKYAVKLGAFNLALDGELNKAKANNDYKAAMEGEQPVVAGQAVTCGLSDGATILLKTFFDKYPRLLVFFYHELFKQDSILETVAKEFAQFKIEKRKNDDEVKAKINDFKRKRGVLKKPDLKAVSAEVKAIQKTMQGHKISRQKSGFAELFKRSPSGSKVISVGKLPSHEYLAMFGLQAKVNEKAENTLETMEAKAKEELKKQRDEKAAAEGSAALSRKKSG